MKDWVKILAGFVIGIIVSYFHWIGLVIGGAAVGFSSRNVKTALMAGLAFGLAVWLSFLITLAMTDMIDKFLSMSPLPYLSLLLTAITTLSASLRSLL